MRIQSPWVVSLVRSDANRDDPEGGPGSFTLRAAGRKISQFSLKLCLQSGPAFKIKATN
jgi:hypothetical protein